MGEIVVEAQNWQWYRFKIAINIEISLEIIPIIEPIVRIEVDITEFIWIIKIPIQLCPYLFYLLLQHARFVKFKPTVEVAQ